MRLRALVVCCATLGCAGSKWRRPTGRLQVFVTAGLVAPGKSDGRPWDGPGSLPSAVSRAAVRGLAPAAQRALLGVMPVSAPLAALATVAPEVAALMGAAYATPDVRVTVSVNGRVVGRTGIAQDTIAPTWAAAPVALPAIPAGSFVEFRAVDSDLVFDDEVGICTITGVPLVDADGYVAPDSFRCMGQLWGLVVRVVELPPAP